MNIIAPCRKAKFFSERKQFLLIWQKQNRGKMFSSESVQFKQKFFFQTLLKKIHTINCTGYRID